MKKDVLISFVHGYMNDNVNIKKEKVPALLRLNAETRKIEEIKNIQFPRTPSDFLGIKSILIGEAPLKTQQMEFKKLPRFGVMGLAKNEQSIFAATWNGIYELNKQSLEEKGFISHRLINDPHGIEVLNGKLYSIVTALDLIVATDIKSGEIIDYFSIDRELNIVRDKKVLEHDWRFISKQERGAVGNWHLNHIRVDSRKIYVTSRLTSSLIEIDVESEKAKLRTVCWDTPVMIHDGRLLSDNQIVFTSVDGKILIAKDANEMKSGITSMKDEAFHDLMQRDMVNTSIRIGEILGREVNWCRGIEEYEDVYITTTDGRYDQDHQYFNITFVQKSGLEIEMIKVPYELLDFSEEIRYMTGFSLLALD